MTVNQLCKALETLPPDAMVLVGDTHRRVPITGLREACIDDIGREWPASTGEGDRVVLILARES